jgi:hypothetical protein
MGPTGGLDNYVTIEMRTEAETMKLKMRPIFDNIYRNSVLTTNTGLVPAYE